VEKVCQFHPMATKNIMRNVLSGLLMRINRITGRITPPGLPLPQGEVKTAAMLLARRGLGGVMKAVRNAPLLKQRRRDLRHNQTEAEKLFWAHVRNKQFHGLRFFRQYSIGPYILDFYCPKLMISIELDGGGHNEDDQREYDAARTEHIKTQGIDVLRFWNNEVLQNISGVLARIAEKITPPGLPLPQGEE